MFLFLMTLVTELLVQFSPLLPPPPIKLSQEDRDYTPSPKQIASYFKKGVFIMDRNPV